MAQKELVAIAPALGIRLQNEKLEDGEAERINGAVPVQVISEVVRRFQTLLPDAHE